MFIYYLFWVPKILPAWVLGPRSIARPLSPPLLDSFQKHINDWNWLKITEKILEQNILLLLHSFMSQSFRMYTYKKGIR